MAEERKTERRVGVLLETRTKASGRKTVERQRNERTERRELKPK